MTTIEQIARYEAGFRHAWTRRNAGDVFHKVDYRHTLRKVISIIKQLKQEQQVLQD